MSKPNISKEAIILSVFLAMAVVAYFGFASFRPKAEAGVTEVKGEKTFEKTPPKVDLPYPMDSQEISVNETSTNTQITLKTSQTPEKVHDFYESVLSSDDWILDSGGVIDNFDVARYKKDKNSIEIETSKQTEESETTIINIEISKN